MERKIIDLVKELEFNKMINLEKGLSNVVDIDYILEKLGEILYENN